MLPDHREIAHGVFPVVFRGYFWGITAIMFPIFALFSVASLVLLPFANSLREAGEALALIVAVPILIPIIAAVQGLIIAGVVILGLRVSRTRIVRRLTSRSVQTKN